MQIKIVMTHHHYLIKRVRQTNKLTTPNFSKDVEPLEFSYMAGRSAMIQSLWKNGLAVSYKYTFITQTTNSTSREMKMYDHLKCMIHLCVNIYSDFLHNHQKLETI